MDTVVVANSACQEKPEVHQRNFWMFPISLFLMKMQLQFSWGKLPREPAVRWCGLSFASSSQCYRTIWPQCRYSTRVSPDVSLLKLKSICRVLTKKRHNTQTHICRRIQTHTCHVTQRHAHATTIVLSWIIDDATTVGKCDGCKQATTHANVQPHWVWWKPQHTSALQIALVKNDAQPRPKKCSQHNPNSNKSPKLHEIKECGRPQNSPKCISFLETFCMILGMWHLFWPQPTSPAPHWLKTPKQKQSQNRVSLSIWKFQSNRTHKWNSTSVEMKKIVRGHDFPGWNVSMWHANTLKDSVVTTRLLVRHIHDETNSLQLLIFFLPKFDEHPHLVLVTAVSSRRPSHTSPTFNPPVQIETFHPMDAHIRMSQQALNSVRLAALNRRNTN